jgi:ribonuclease E
VKLYSENKPLFTKHGVETHLDALFSPTVTLPSGGYIVINQTEALVSIDINSGKATREHNIEDTATKTNLEACDEIGRQLRLRDLAGLVVIDFIDMEENRNNRNVERRIKEALKNDRARIQVGRISHFGLLEMSRQRLRPGLIEGTFRTCPHCEGRGMTRSIPSCGLGVLRQIEDHLLKRPENVTVTCAREVAAYLLNEKRDSLLILEQTYGITIFVHASLHEVKGTHAAIERAQDREHVQRRLPAAAPVRMETALADEPEEDVVEDDVGEESAEANGDAEKNEGTGENGRGRRRRRGRRGGRKDRTDEGQVEAAENDNAEADPQEGDDRPFDGEAQAVEPAEGDAEPSDEPRQDGEREPRRGRGRRDRFGRNRNRRDEKPEASAAPASEGADQPVEAGDDQPRQDREPRRERGGRGRGRERGDRGERHDRGPREPQLVTPTEPAFKLEIPEVIAEPEVRKWTPPAPTIQAEATPKKGGWWAKRKET